MPLRVTLPYKIWHLTHTHLIEAIAQFEAVQDAALKEKMTDKAFNDMVAEKGQVSEELERLYKADAISLEHFNARVQGGEIPSMPARNRSEAWVTALLGYRAAQGNLSKADKNTLKELWEQQAIRVVQNCDVIFTTVINTPAKILKHGFSPNITVVDDAGQVTSQAALVPLTCYKDSVKLNYLFGDTKQLLPFKQEKLFDEFILMSKVPILTFLENRGYPLLRLTLQYRMAPAISQFPSRYFYDGHLRDDASVLLDNPSREAFRRVWKIVTEKNVETEYGLIDVVNGVSRTIGASKTPQNPASADAVLHFARRLLVNDVSPGNITILVYYKGQRGLIKAKAARVPDEPRLGEIEIKTVDAFQGAQNKFILLDLVSAGFRAPANKRSADAESSKATTGIMPTAHLREPNRLCCALTRAEDGLVVFMNSATIFRNWNGNTTSAARRALQDLVKDGYARGVIWRDNKTIDTSAEMKELRAHWTQQAIDQAIRDDFLKTSSALYDNRQKIWKRVDATKVDYQSTSWGSRRKARNVPGSTTEVDE